MAWSAVQVVVAAVGVAGLFALGRRLFRGGAVELGLFRAKRDKQRRSVRELGEAAAYHNKLPAEDRADSLDDRTWSDLDLDDVFLAIDHTVSQPGRQYFYHVLRTPLSSAASLESFERGVDRVSRDPKLADRIRDALAVLNDDRAASLVNLVFDGLPLRPRFWWLFPILTLGSVGCLVSIVVWPRALILWIAICVVNVLMQLVYKARLKAIVPALHEVPAFVRAAGTLAALDAPEFADQSQRLRDGAMALGLLRKATMWLMFEPGQTNELAASFYEYVNLMFLIDVNAFAIAGEALRESRGYMRGVFDAIGYFDTVQSVAAWRATLCQWTIPTFSDDGKRLHAESVFHPLLSDPIPNTIDTGRSSLLITGSNMSGKTTFVRTIGVNAVLATTLNTVCAAAWSAPMFLVRTSIGRSDSITEGKSYYLAEVESVGELIRAKESGRKHLFLLDEIFRGTNTTERVAAAYAVLSYLNRGADLVIVATHDIEVIGLLGAQYASYHFREEIAGGTVAFDYQIRPGPASSRNAIALLELMKYPAEVVSDAIAALDWKDR